MYCGFNNEKRKILNDITALDKYQNSREKDFIEHRGKRVIFEGWAVDNPPTGPIPKAVAVLGYELKDGYRRITDDRAKREIEEDIRENWGGRITNIYFIQPTIDTEVHFIDDENGNPLVTIFGEFKTPKDLIP